MLNNRLTMQGASRFPASKILARQALLLAIATLFFFGCKVTLIGAYDEVTDQSIQKVQTDVYSILVRLERNIDDRSPADNDYKNFKEMYGHIAAELEVLRIRCGAIPKYDIIQGQVTALTENMSNLEKLHRIGITSSALLTPVKSAFELQFRAILQLQNSLKKAKKNKVTK